MHSNIAGTYVITYSVRDNAGNYVEQTRTVKVGEKYKVYKAGKKLYDPYTKEFTK